MDYKEIKLNVSNDSISEYKVFEGRKLYSEVCESENRKTLISKRIYITKKQNYVYYQRTDVNWNYWSDKEKYNSSFDSNCIKREVIFEVSPQLEKFRTYLKGEIIDKIIKKEQNGEIVEYLDI